MFYTYCNQKLLILIIFKSARNYLFDNVMEFWNPDESSAKKWFFILSIMAEI